MNNLYKDSIKFKSCKSFPFILFFAFFIFSFFNISAQKQSYIDSLQKITNSTSNKKTIIECYNKIANEYLTSSTYDSLKLYATKALNLSKQVNYDQGQATSISLIAAISYDKGDYEKALELYSTALRLFKKSGDKEGIARIYTSLGNVYISKTEYAKALQTYLNSQKLLDELLAKKPNNKVLIQSKANNYNNIGNVNFYTKNYNESQSNYLQAKELYEIINDKQNAASLLNNIGIISRINGNNQESIDYRLKALKIFEEINNLEGLAYGNLGLGNIYADLKQVDEAAKYYNQSLKYYEQMGSKKGAIMIYINLCELYSEKHDFGKSIKLLENALKLCYEINNKDLRKDVYNSYANLFEKKNNYKEALRYHRLYSALNDSIYSYESQQTVTEMQTKYETEKKEKEIVILNKEKEVNQVNLQKKEVEIKNQKILIYSFVIGFLLVLVFSIVIYRLFIQKKLANIILAQQKEEITTQRDEIEAQRNEITIHRDIILEQKNAIEDSINYAKRIQEAVLPISIESRSILGDHFIFYKPKDIVSGDFYWTAKIEQNIIIAVADCTGHGVPGAFMSMLGISFLNEIVRKKENTEVGIILNDLRKEIINALQQRASNSLQEVSTYDLSTVKDGMDIALISLNTETMMLHFAGANNPVYIIRNKELVELKGDKMPIAIHIQMDSFNSHEYKIEKGDNIYLMSDGFEDQFGGLDNKKFKSKPLKNLLCSISELPMENQFIELEKTLHNWMGKAEQVDDITVLGIKI